MLKRVWLFLLTNIAIMIVLSLSFSILTNVFWIQYASVFSWSNYAEVLIFAAVIWFMWAFISLLLSKPMAKWSYKIQIIDSNNLHQLTTKERFVYNVVERISNQVNMKIPEVWVYESDEPNAFATWATKNSSLVAVSTWLLNTMWEDEIEWVIAHEMAHIINGDMVTMVLIQWVINTFVIFISRIVASFIEKIILKSEESGTWVYYVVSIILEILLWILASIIVMWFSRYREFKADEWSAKFVWKEKMIAALKSLQRIQDRMLTDDADKLATLKIGSKQRSWIFALFSSHPDLEDRIKNLEGKF